MVKEMSGERVLSLFNMLALQVVGLGVLLFWTIGSVLMLTGNGGQILDIEWSSLSLTAYYAFPILLVICSAIAWLAYWRKSDLFAMGVLSAPIGLMLLLYLYLILGR